MEGLKDPRMQQFVAAETQKQRYQQILHTMTEECWDICMQGSPGHKLDRKTEGCFTNCVDRFLDSSNFIVNRLEKEGQMHMSRNSSGMSSDSFSSPSSTGSDYTSQGFKWN